MIIATQFYQPRRKPQRAKKAYRLWFIAELNGSIYSAFYECKGGSDQGCKHLGTAFFEHEEFLSNERTSVTCLPAHKTPTCKQSTPINGYFSFKKIHTKAKVLYHLVIRGLTQ